MATLETHHGSVGSKGELIKLTRKANKGDKATLKCDGKSPKTMIFDGESWIPELEYRMPSAK